MTDKCNKGSSKQGNRQKKFADSVQVSDLHDRVTGARHMANGILESRKAYKSARTRGDGETNENRTDTTMDRLLCRQLSIRELPSLARQQQRVARNPK